MCPTAFFKLLHQPGLYPQTFEHPESRRRYEPITELLWELNWRLRCVINSSLFIKECDTTIICLFIAVSGAGKLVPPSCFTRRLSSGAKAPILWIWQWGSNPFPYNCRFLLILAHFVCCFALSDQNLFPVSMEFTYCVCRHFGCCYIAAMASLTPLHLAALATCIWRWLIVAPWSGAAGKLEA